MRTFLIALLLLGFAGTGRSSPRALPAADAQQLWSETMMSAAQALKANRFDLAVARCEQAITLARSFGPRDTHLSRSQVLRAELYVWAKDQAAAEQMFATAVQSCEAAVGPRDPELVHPLSSLANFYTYARPQPGRVVALLERIRAIVEQAPGRDIHDAIVWSRNLALAYQQNGDNPHAETAFARAIALAQTGDPSWLPQELLTCAQFYRQTRQPVRAAAHAARAVAVREAALAHAAADPDAKLDLIVALDELAADHLAAGAGAEAEAESRRSLALAESFMSADQPELRPRLAGLAAVLAARGKWDEAATVYHRLLALAEQNLGAENPEVATVLTEYASVLRRLDRTADAAGLESRAADIRRRLTPAS